MTALSRLKDYWQMTGEAQRRYGVGRWQQASEMFRLSRGPGQVGPGDYFNYRLFEPDLPWEEKLRFIGWRAERRLDSLNQADWHGLGLDKVLMYNLLGEQGLSMPETRAIYLPGRARSLGKAAALTTPQALHAWLRDPANYPFFSKPSASGFGRGTYQAVGYDSTQDRVLLQHGKSIDVKAFTESMVDRERLGYLFQTPLRTDPRLLPLLGPNLASLRVMVLGDEEVAPRIHRVFWKISTGTNINDNYNGGIDGNLAAAIDPVSGRITRVINGAGLGLREVTHHPDTGCELSGLAVPDWDQVQAFALQVSLLFPKLRFQQWDVALTDKGPTALEVNLFGTGGGDLSQLLERRGLLDANMQQRLEAHGL